MAYDIDGIEHKRLVKYLDSFNRRLADVLSARLPVPVLDCGPDVIREVLSALVAEEHIAFDFLASDIASACMERAEEAEGRAEEAENTAQALRDNPELTAPEHGPEALRWDERERAFICPLTRSRFRLVRETD